MFPRIYFEELSHSGTQRLLEALPLVKLAADVGYIQVIFFLSEYRMKKLLD